MTLPAFCSLESFNKAVLLPVVHFTKGNRSNTLKCIFCESISEIFDSDMKKPNLQIMIKKIS